MVTLAPKGDTTTIQAIFTIPPSISQVREVRVDEFESDFGPLVSRQSIYQELVGVFLVVEPVFVNVYYSDNTYTAILDPFDHIIGQGESVYRAILDAKEHLRHSRAFYGSLGADKGTPGAQRRRMQMLEHLRVI